MAITGWLSTPLTGTATYTNNDRTIEATSSSVVVRSDTSHVAGEWQFEVKIIAQTSSTSFGLCDSTGSLFLNWSSDGSLAGDLSGLSAGTLATYTADDYLTFCINLDDGFIDFFKNGVQTGTTYTISDYSALTGTTYISGALSTIGDQVTLNIGADNFGYRQAGAPDWNGDHTTSFNTSDGADNYGSGTVSDDGLTIIGTDSISVIANYDEEWAVGKKTWELTTSEEGWNVGYALKMNIIGTANYSIGWIPWGPGGAGWYVYDETAGTPVSGPVTTPAPAAVSTLCALSMDIDYDTFTFSIRYNDVSLFTGISFGSLGIPAAGVSGFPVVAAFHGPLNYTPPTGYSPYDGPISVPDTSGAGSSAGVATATAVGVALRTALAFDNANSASTTTVGIPPHVAGDLILIWAFRDGNATPPTLPSGYTNIANNTSTSLSGRLGYRIATANNTTSNTWTNATELVVLVYKPRTGGAVRIGNTAINANASSATFNYPALTFQRANGTSWLAAFSGHRSTNTNLQSPPTGTVLRNNLADATAEVSAFDSNGAVSSWSSTNVSGTGTTSGWSSVVVEIQDLAQQMVGTAAGTTAGSAVSRTLMLSIGTATGISVASGVGSSSNSSNSTITGVGSSAGVGAASGVLSVIAAATGTAAGTTGGTAILSAVASMTGTAVGSGVASGVLKTTATSTGTAAGSGVATGTLAVTARIVGTAAGITGGSATLAASGPMIGSAAGSGVATATGRSTATATGTAAGTCTASGVLAVTKASTGSAAGTTSVSGVVRTTATAVGSVSGIGTASAAILAVTPIVGSTAGASEGIGVLRATANLTGSSAGVGAASGIEVAIANLTGSASGTTTVSAVSKTFMLTVGTAAGSGVAVSTGRSTATATGTSSGTSQAIGNSNLADQIVTGVGTAAGTSSVTATSITLKRAVGSIAGIGSASASATLITPSIGSSTGNSTVNGTLRATATAVGSAQGAATGTGSATSIKTMAGSSVGTAIALAGFAVQAATTGLSVGNSSVTANSLAFAFLTGNSSGVSNSFGLMNYIMDIIGVSEGTSTATAYNTAYDFTNVKILAKITINTKPYQTNIVVSDQKTPEEVIIGKAVQSSPVSIKTQKDLIVVKNTKENTFKVNI